MKKIAIVLIIIATFMLSGCKAIKAKKALEKQLDNLKIYYDGNKIVWDEIKNAEYNITINNEHYEVAKSEFSYKAIASFDFFLAIKIEGKEIRTYQKHFSKLSTVESLTNEENMIMWEEVDEASHYAIKVNGVVVDTNIITSAYPLSTTGKVTISVKALSDDINSFSDWSEPLTLIILNKPENITYDIINGTVTWDQVPGALSYSVIINGTETKTNNNYIIIESKENIVVKVRAESQDAISSEYSSECMFRYIEPIKNIQIENGAVTWESEANNFYISLNNDVFLHDLSTLNNLEPNVEYNLKIYPYINDEHYSDWTNIQTFSILPKPDVTCDVLALSEIITWDNIKNANCYHITVYEQDEIIYNNELVKTNAFYIGGICCNPQEYIIEVKAISNSSQYKSSAPSIVNVVRLSAPTEYAVSHTPLEQSATTITFKAANNAINHTITSEYVEVGIIDEKTFKITESKKNTNYVIIEVMANGYVLDNVYYLDSIEPLTINIKRMNVPTNLYVENNIAYWQGNASSYAVAIDGEIISTNDNFYPLDVSTGSHSLRIRSISSNDDVISSAFTTNIEVTKLQTPTDLTIENKILKWSGPNEKCIVKVDDTEYVASNNFNLSAIPILTTGTIITVQALGNANYVLDSDKSEPFVIYKLNSPTNLSLYNEAIRWQQPINNPMGYRIYQDNILLCEIANNMIDAKIFAAPGKYNIQIQAIGNQVTTFDSDLSEVVTFTKLEPITQYELLDKKIIFMPITDSCGYEIKVLETSYYINKSTTEFIIPTSANVVMIRALGDDSKNIIKSEWQEIK